MAQSQQDVFSLFPSSMRGIMEALYKAKKVAVVGYDIYIDLSEAITLPEAQFPEKVYQFKNRGGDMTGTQAGKSTQMKWHAPSGVRCFSCYYCKGLLEGYKIRIEGKKINPHGGQVDDAVFGKTRAKQNEYHMWNFGGFSTDSDTENAITISPRKDAILYCFMSLSELDTKNEIFAGVDRTVSSGLYVGLVTFKDPTKDTMTKNDNLAKFAEAITFVRTLNADQLKLLKEKVLPDLGTDGAELAKATVKDTIISQLDRVIQKGHAMVLLKYKPSFEETENAGLQVSKGILADAMAMGVLEWNREHGLLVGQTYENKFLSAAKPIKIGNGLEEFTRLQFHEPTQKIAQTVSEYMANYPNMGDVRTLTILVEEMRQTFSELDITKSGIPEFNALRKKNGIFAKYVTE